jgi:CBS domain-containing protein
MQVKEIMTRGCECISPDSTLQEAAQRMKTLDVGPLPVCSEDRLVGIVTDRDIVLRAVAEGHDPKTARVRDVMTPNITWCLEDQDVAEAARLMKNKQIRRLVVLNRDKRLVGILSLGDLAVDTRDERLAGETLERISEPAKPRGTPAGTR